jgi:hypothetical protein
MDNTPQLNKRILKASKEGQVFIKNEKGNLVPVEIKDLTISDKKVDDFVKESFVYKDFIDFIDAEFKISASIEITSMEDMKMFIMQKAILDLDELYGLDKNYLDRKLYKIESGKLVLDEEKLNKIRRTL